MIKVDIKKDCLNYGKLPDCKTCTSSLSNKMIGDCTLFKDCFKGQFTDTKTNKIHTIK